MTDLHSVHTFVDHGMAAAERLESRGLSEPAAVMGGVAIGFMRALLECDCQPGVFRIPQDKDWHTLHCPHCDGWWHATNA